MSCCQRSKRKDGFVSVVQVSTRRADATDSVATDSWRKELDKGMARWLKRCGSAVVCDLLGKAAYLLNTRNNFYWRGSNVFSTTFTRTMTRSRFVTPVRVNAIFSATLAVTLAARLWDVLLRRDVAFDSRIFVSVKRDGHDWSLCTFISSESVHL